MLWWVVAFSACNECPDNTIPLDGDSVPAQVDTDTTDTEAPPADSGYSYGEQPDAEHLALYPPSIISTIPIAGDQAVDPNLERIEVVFSKDMVDENWAWVQISDTTFPEIVGGPRYEADMRTHSADVLLEPDTTYVIWFNFDPYISFRDTDGNAAVPYLLTFHTAPAL